VRLLINGKRPNVQIKDLKDERDREHCRRAERAPSIRAFANIRKLTTAGDGRKKPTLSQLEKMNPTRRKLYDDRIEHEFQTSKPWLTGAQDTSVTSWAAKETV
jgi:hypothetical protein